MSQSVHNREVSPEMEEGKMNKMNIARLLLDGSARIDLMRKEIDRVIAMVTESVVQDSTKFFTETEFRSMDFVWRILFRGTHLKIVCQLPSGVVVPLRDYDVEVLSYRYAVIPARYVTEVHAGLEVLVSKMLATSSHFDEVHQQLIDAGMRGNET